MNRQKMLDIAMEQYKHWSVQDEADDSERHQLIAMGAIGCAANIVSAVFMLPDLRPGDLDRRCEELRAQIAYELRQHANSQLPISEFSDLALKISIAIGLGDLVLAQLENES